ncbi:signal peptidase I [Roseateles chitinivorans]|uniref:signal peptidase I n=1 Tax=Roseateles chitinivorans TaxID=2917965 RepID=UPI003D663E47
MLDRVFRHFLLPKVQFVAARSEAARHRMRATKVLAGHMAPTLRQAEVVWYAPWAGDGPLSRSQVVVVTHSDYEGALVPLRVVGLPGESLEIVEGDLLIDGHRLPEPYLLESQAQEVYSRSVPRVVVAAGTYWLMGDFRDMCKDSRVLGPFAVSTILGEVSKAHPLGGHRAARNVR